MALKAFVICAFALSIQSIAGLLCYRPPAPKPCGCNSETVSITMTEEGNGPSYYQSIPAPCSSNHVSIGISENNGYQLSPSSIVVLDNGGAFAVTSIGPIAPAGIAVATDLGLSGDLVLSGVLPYLSAVAFEGQFATGGAAEVSYGCGDTVAINEQIGGNTCSLAGGSLNLNLGGCGCGH